MFDSATGVERLPINIDVVRPAIGRDRLGISLQGQNLIRQLVWGPEIIRIQKRNQLSLGCLNAMVAGCCRPPIRLGEQLDSQIGLGLDQSSGAIAGAIIHHPKIKVFVGLV